MRKLVFIFIVYLMCSSCSTMFYETIHSHNCSCDHCRHYRYYHPSTVYYYRPAAKPIYRPTPPPKRYVPHPPNMAVKPNPHKPARKPAVKPKPVPKPPIKNNRK